MGDWKLMLGGGVTMLANEEEVEWSVLIWFRSGIENMCWKVVLLR